MRLGSRSPEHKCSEHGLFMVKVGEEDGIEQLVCPVCVYEDLKWMSELITEQKTKIRELEEALDER